VLPLFVSVGKINFIDVRAVPRQFAMKPEYVQIVQLVNEHIKKWKELADLPGFGDESAAPAFARTVKTIFVKARDENIIVSEEVAKSLQARFAKRCEYLETQMGLQGCELKTCVLLVTCHGGIPVHNGKPMKIIVPPNLLYTRVTCVPPGVINVTSKMKQKFVGTHTLDIMTRVPYRVNPKAFVDTVIDKVEQVQRTGDERYPYQWYMDEHAKHVMRPQAVMYFPGEKCLQKVFKEDSAKDVNWLFDSTMRLLNEPAYPNLLDGQPGGLVTLTSVFRVVQQKGYQHVIMIDMSCSSFNESAAVPLSKQRKLVRKALLGGQ
jgi:hypothetical protein